MLSVSSLKGGVGKTSVTLGLASAAYSRGIPTLVIDMDPQADASTGLDIPVRTEVDIADVLAAPRKRVLENAVVPSGWVGDQRGHIDVISGSPRAAEFDQPTLSLRYLRRLSEAIQKAGAGYRLVLIDCPPSLNGLTRAAWTASSRVLIVTEPGLFSVAAADRALRATDELRRRAASDLQPLGIVVNRARLQSREHSYRIEELREMFGPLVVNPPIPERTVLQQAQGSARPIHSWPGKPAAELAAAFDKILDRALRSERIRRKTEKKATADTSAASGADTASTAAQPAKKREDSASTPASESSRQPSTDTKTEDQGPRERDQTARTRQKTAAKSAEESAAPTGTPPTGRQQEGGSGQQQDPRQTIARSLFATAGAPHSDAAKSSAGAQAGAGTPPGSQAQSTAGRTGSHASSQSGRRPQPPKPTSAPTVGSQPNDQPADRPATGRDGAAVETAAMPVVDSETGPAPIHEPAGGEEAFMTRRELREQRERDKNQHAKRKWFGR